MFFCSFLALERDELHAETFNITKATG